MTLRLLVIAGLLALAAAAPMRAQDDVPALVAKAVAYVDDYEAKFAAVVCEERQTQRVIKADGSLDKQRELVSDVLLFKSGFVSRTFRDVISVDGKPVGDRRERLAKLFLGSGQNVAQQAAAISKESDRYNIGFPRDMDTLMLPLAVLNKARVAAFRFTRTADGLTFAEANSPTLVHFNSGGKAYEMPLSGSFQVTSEGHVTGASLVAQNPLFQLTVELHYGEDARTALLVPTESRERYQTTKAKEHLEVVSTYANFRKFEVRTDEQVVTPPK